MANKSKTYEKEQLFEFNKCNLFKNYNDDNFNNNDINNNKY